ncbi:MAG: enoyl-CoA hydratase-related protein [Novosphingobium sp.]
MTGINSVTSYVVEDGIAVVTLDSPPVNALGHQVRLGIAAGLDRAFADTGIDAVVLICGGRTFFAGADINEFGKPLASPVLREIAVQMEGANKPVVAAIHGTALGGGLETALACHWRIAVPTARLGLPEVKLGILAGAGGTQRLPRLVGAAKALDMVVSGEPIDAKEAFELGLVDALADGDLRADAILFARAVAQQEGALRRVRAMPAAQASATLFTDFRAANAERLKGFEAPEASIRCIEAATVEDFDEGMRIERSLFEGLVTSAQCAAQRYIFFAEREAAKVPGLVKGVTGPSGDMVGFIGADEIKALIDAAGIEIVPPRADILVLDGEGTPDSENAVAIRLAPSPAKLMEFLKHPGLSDGALASALALAKRLELASVVTLSGDRFIGQRMADQLARTVRDCVGDGLPEADLRATADAFGIAIAPAGGAPEIGRPLEGDAAQGVIERLLAPLINEGAHMLEEGAAARASDIDIACVKSGLFKAYLGGPLFQAGQLGLFRIIDTLIEHQQRWGDAHGPSRLLERVAGNETARHECKGMTYG